MNTDIILINSVKKTKLLYKREAINWMKNMKNRNLYTLVWMSEF